MSTRSAPNVPVLMYHHVTPAGGMIAATPDVFEDQIARLARPATSRCRPISSPPAWPARPCPSVRC